MNNKKICFITAINNESLYNECVDYIKSLKIPLGYEIDFKPIRGAKSICNAYNIGMKLSDAKYKIYLHQDVFIIEKDFIKEIIDIFEKDLDIGMIGVCGSKYIPTSGVWWESIDKVGKVYENRVGKIDLLEFQEIINSYEHVNGVDGLIIVTQHDINWREDIFDGWHFYDVSQSLEYLKNNYKVVVPKQEKPWCIHYSGIVNTETYEKYRSIFVKEYYSYLK